ncbi:DNA translocase FtsK [Vibrio navarrensis]|uniref:DNA translocase FtsK n=1 Tax=Vibrio navarrensis TaxID=29495 RepID=UPI00338FA7AD
MFKENAKKVETIIKTSEEPQSSRLNGFQRLKECGLILGVLSSVLLATALITFSPADPSWSQTAWGGGISNAGGILGAWIADTLFFTFGLLAYPLPLLLTIAAWVFFRKRDEDEHIDLMLWGTRLLGLVILILTSCGLADINFDDIWYFSSGGVIGDVLTNLALPVLNLLGTTLVLLFLWGAGFTLLTGISWLAIVESLGNLAIGLFVWLVNKVRGDAGETLEPQLQNISLERESSDTPNVSEKTQDLPQHHDEEYLEEPAVAASPQTDYPIHMPSQANYHADIASEIPQETRSQKLTATIEELEQEAMFADDMPVESHVYSQPTASPVESAPENAEPPWLQDEPSFEPAISASELDKIGDEMGEPHRREPVMSSLEDDLDSPPWMQEAEEYEAQTPLEQQSWSSSETETSASYENDESEEELQADQADEDVTAFQNMVSQAQQNMAGANNPFLMKKEQNLPVPQEPLPTLELLYHPEKRENFIDKEALEHIARLVESKLADYKIKARVVGIFPGPVITRFELDLAPGVKVSRISSLSMDLARSLSAMAVRVVEVIPGKPYVGLELPNMSRQTVYLSDVIASPQFEQATSPTTVVLGQDIAGEALVADLSKMPHVLVAGTTGSGKSVGVNVMILSMLYKASPEEVRFIMIDPKMLELSVYEGIPHLLAEVVTDMKDASNALRWCVGEMERRYKLMSVMGVRNIKGFNEKLKMAAEAGHPIHDPLWKEGDSMDTEPPLLEKLPYIVVVVDEFADLMMVVGKKVEELIARLAQKARAAGIHLILATQRPSVDVITGLIKANIPTRVAFTVSTKTDSRTILDQGGAESLLGMGDMLYLPPGSSHTIRVHGAFASDDDVHAVVNNWKARGKPNYIEEIVSGDQGPDALLPGEQMESDDELDPLFDQVVEHVVQSRRGSVSGVQRRFKIGYNRAARIVEQLEAQGIVSAPGHNGNREVLAPAPPRD